MFTAYKTKKLFLWVICASLIIGGSITAQPPVKSVTSPNTTCYPFEITIGQVDNVIPGQSISIPIAKTEGNQPTGGFELVLAFDDQAMTMLGVTAGDPFDSLGFNQWEVFNYRVEQWGDYSTIHILGMADQLGGNHEPDQYYLPNGAILLSLDFIVNEVSSDTNASIPVSFYWTGCADNALSNPMGDSLYISYHVYDPEGSDITDTAHTLPSFYGAPEECISGTSMGPHRFIDFVNGGVNLASPNDRVPFTIGIGNLLETTAGEFVSIPVTKLTGSEPMGGFDFLFVYDNAQLTFVEAIPGEIFAIPGNYEWEYFNYRYDDLDTSLGTPLATGNIRVVAVADVNNGMHSAKETYIPDGIALFSINFNVNDTSPDTSSFTPVSFYWTDCTDNALSNPMGDSLFISYHVYDPEGSDITDTAHTLPSFYGAPYECDLGTAFGPYRFVDFINGGVNITSSSDRVPFAIEIGQSDEALAGDIVSIPVTKIAGSEPMGGFDFLFAYDNAQLTFVEAIPGEIFAIPGSYEWEYFTYRYYALDTCLSNPCPTNAMRVVAAADVNNGAHFSKETYIPNGTELFSLDFTINEASRDTGTFVPVSFYWIDCGDNALSNPMGDSLYISYHVYDPEGSDITDTTHILPSFYGAPYECDPGTSFGPYRFIDFINGGVNLASPNDRVPFAIDIGHAYDVHPGDTIYIPVTKIAGSESMDGFDFLIRYDDTTLTFIEAVPGILWDTPGDYEWEVFYSRLGSLDTCTIEPCPGGTQRIIGIANTLDGLGDKPKETYVDDGTVLFTLKFYAEDFPAYECHYAPLDFFWFNCTHNAIAIAMDSTTISALSNKVYTGDGVDITDPDAGFPGIYGAPNDCFNSGPNSAVRLVDFHHGYIGFDCGSPIMGIGDINCNGIGLEIADMVMFDLYLLNGLSAFGEHVEQSTANSDINMDGIPLQLEDFALMFKVQCGAGELPFPPPVHDTTIFTQDSENRTVSFERPNSLSLIYLVFDGEIVPEFPEDTLGNLIRYYQYDGQYTGVIIRPEYADCQSAFPSGHLFNYTGDGRLVQVRAADFNNHVFHTSIICSSDVCGDNNGDESINVGDAVWLITFIFKGGAEPFSPIAGDVNCDESTNIGDVVWLINYVFKHGSAPCDCY
ncbi:MAG: hypothetical protein GY841_22220 [FCB group bacterium]|nr:hypothetical protein [FCB group bacterium]